MWSSEKAYIHESFCEGYVVKASTQMLAPESFVKKVEDGEMIYI